MIRPTLLRFLIWLIWCYAARRPLFHKSYRRSCYAPGLYSNAEGGTRETTKNRVGNKLPTLPTTDTFLVFK
ncbi:hypothetical protein EDD22DRAFT_922321 [Suillus occidentalis]|nr:hypothetical protein EDD22DRAFT_922321 [Suillus occidentalis]